MILIPFLVSFLFIVSYSVHASTVNKIDVLIDRFKQQNQIPSLAVAVIHLNRFLDDGQLNPSLTFSEHALEINLKFSPN